MSICAVVVLLMASSPSGSGYPRQAGGYACVFDPVDSSGRDPRRSDNRHVIWLSWTDASGRATRIILTISVAWSAISCATLLWLLPAANQSYREALADGNGIERRMLTKGMNEMTLSELSGRIDSYRGAAMAESALVRELTFSYHQRWSFACATAVLALFAVGVLARRPSARWIVGLAAVGACCAYYGLLFLGRSAALAGTIPSFAGAWLPNVVFVLLSALLIEVGSPLAPMTPE
jgi:lipopolysaccharide export LptBFGC system permease protein LptF